MMTKNREIAEIIFEAVKNMGYKPYDIEYGNGYFIFDNGEDSVIYFKLKGLGILGKHWKFGLWINSQYLDEKYRKEEKNKSYDNLYKVVQLFSQYDTQIDKFKPSISALCVEYYAADWNSHIENNSWWKIEDMLGMIKKHPLLCYADFCGKCANYYNGSFLIDFIKCNGRYKINKIKEILNTAFWLPYTKLKISLSKYNSIIDNIQLYDFEKENPGLSTDYKYQVKIIFSENATEEKMIKWLNFWWKKMEYGHYKHFGSVIELDNFKQIGYDKSFIFEKGE